MQLFYGTGQLELPEQPQEAGVVMGRGHGRNSSAGSSVWLAQSRFPPFLPARAFPPGKLLVLQSLSAAIVLAETKAPG